MNPAKMPLALYRGDTYTWRFTLWADAAKTLPADLTDVTVKAELRAQPAGALLATLDCAVELPNVITATLSAAISSTLPPKGVWDMQLTYPADVVATILAGTVDVVADVTDSAIAPQTRRSPGPRSLSRSA